MMYISYILGEWLSQKKWQADDLAQQQPTVLRSRLSAAEPAEEPTDEPAENETAEPATVMQKLRRIDGLNADFALERMGGFDDIYEKTIRILARSLKDTIAKIEKSLDEANLKGFTVEVHGLKGALQSVGATKLGGSAASLERAGTDGETDYCIKYFPAFRAELMDFSARLDEALEQNEGTVKEKISKEKLAEVIEQAKAAAEGFDAVSAAEILGTALGFCYSEEVDRLIAEAVFALEVFDCEGAIAKIEETEEAL